MITIRRITPTTDAIIIIPICSFVNPCSFVTNAACLSTFNVYVVFTVSSLGEVSIIIILLLPSFKLSPPVVSISMSSFSVVGLIDNAVISFGTVIS